MKSYPLNNQDFRQKEMRLKEDEKFLSIISKLDTKIPVQFNFASDMLAVSGGVLASIIASKKTPQLLDLIIEPVEKNFLLKFKLYRYWLYRNSSRKVIAEIFSDFFLEGSTATSCLLNRLLILLSERATQLMKSNMSSQGSESISQNITV
ncbi:MAG: hypothetical protein KF721_04780 [Ignavibacteriaceae bacterium]|nr:hypothetical protein [Ignavibacteriaceae bacterium]